MQPPGLDILVVALIPSASLICYLQVKRGEAHVSMGLIGWYRLMVLGRQYVQDRSISSEIADPMLHGTEAFPIVHRLLYMAF